MGVNTYRCGITSKPICFATQGDFCGLLDFVKVWNLLKMEIFLIHGSQYIQPWHYISTNLFRNSRRLLRSIGFCQGLEFTENGDIFDTWESIHAAMALHLNQSVSQLKSTFAVYWILSRFGIY